VLEQLNIEVPGLSINRPQEERRNFRAMRWIVATFILIACLIESSAALAEENHSMPNKTTTETSTDPDSKKVTPELKHLDQLSYVGFTIRTSLKDESIPASAKIPSLWQRFYGENAANKIGDQVSPHQILGVYSDYQSDYTGEYSLSEDARAFDRFVNCNAPVSSRRGAFEFGFGLEAAN
jgi:hypothetical protein